MELCSVCLIDSVELIESAADDVAMLLTSAVAMFANHRCNDSPTAAITRSVCRIINRTAIRVSCVMSIDNESKVTVCHVLNAYHNY